MADKQNPLDDMTKFMGQFKLPGVDMAAIIEARRKDIEALVEANKAALASMQALGAKQTEMFKEAMQGIQESAKAGLTGAAITTPPNGGDRAEGVREGDRGHEGSGRNDAQIPGRRDGPHHPARNRAHE